MSRLYLEPRTEGPAEQDWSTGLILAETRSTARVMTFVAVLLPLAVCLAVVLPVTPGNVSSIGVLGLLGLLGSIGPFILLAGRRPHRRRLLGQPWRRCPATVAAAEKPHDPRPRDRVGGSLAGAARVAARCSERAAGRQELFLVGPDDKGHALIRVAGLCQMFAVKVDTGKRDREREPHLPGHPPDAGAFRRLRRGAHCWVYPAAVGVVGAVVLMLGLRQLSPLALVVGGVLLIVAAVTIPLAVVISRYYAKAAAAAKAATGWTSLPITLFPWEPTNVVAGLLQLPGGAALIQFPLPHLDVIANIADTARSGSGATRPRWSPSARRGCPC